MWKNYPISGHPCREVMRLSVSYYETQMTKLSLSVKRADKR